MDEKHERQSFLGDHSETLLSTVRIGVVGLGGGGSHVVQQLAHAGFTNLALFDGDKVERRNLNRLVGATAEDARQGVLKIEVAKRVVLGLHPKAQVALYPSRWQESAQALHLCDLVFACVDTFSQREQLEKTCRRYLMPMIDIGIDLHEDKTGGPPGMAGQVLLSMPGHACLWCLKFLRQDYLAREAAAYGAVGGRPQVVWSNGVVASTAVGVAVDLLTDWTQSLRSAVYLVYDGNRGVLTVHPRINFADPTCTHFDPRDVGPPVFRPL